jgi:hypothetical protein
VGAHQVLCLRSLVGNAKLTVAFKKQLEDYLHIPESKVKNKAERAGRRALMLLHILAKPDLTAPALDWKEERKTAWDAVDTLTAGATGGPTAKMQAEVLYKFNKDEVSWVGLMPVALSTAFLEVVTKYGTHMPGDRRDEIKGRVESAPGLTFQECPQNMYRTSEGLILGVTTPAPVASWNRAWPRVIKLVRGVWGYTTALHELLHFCCHDNFWNVALGEKRDPLNPASSFHEGVTQYFTLQVEQDGARDTSYQAQVGAVKMMMAMAQGGRGRGKAQMVSEADVIAAYFGGVGTEVFQVSD